MSRPQFTQRGALKKHDYSGRCIYHVTLVVSDRLPLLGWLDAQGWKANEAGRETTDTQNGNHTISYRRSVPKKWMVRLCHSDLGEEVARKVRAIPTICHAKGLDVQILAQQCMISRTLAFLHTPRTNAYSLPTIQRKASTTTPYYRHPFRMPIAQCTSRSHSNGKLMVQQRKKGRFPLFSTQTCHFFSTNQ